MTERRYVCGYGRTRHILDESKPHSGRPNDGYGLCGAWGGHPLTDDTRPVCQHCLRLDAKQESKP